MKKSKKSTLIALSVTTAIAATATIPVVLTACNGGESDNSNNNNQPQPTPPTPSPDKPSGTKKDFNQELAQKLYDLINSKANLNKTIGISNAKALLENNKDLLNQIKTTLSISSDVTSLVVKDLNTITITLSSNTELNNGNATISNTNLTLNDTAITISNSNGLFLPSLTNTNASDLYNALSSIFGALDGTVRLRPCQKIINTPENKTKVKTALGINVDITNIDLNFDTIIITLSSNYYSTEKTNFDLNDVTYSTTANTVQMDTNGRPFFAMDYAEFNQQTAKNLYNAVNNIVKLDKTATIQAATNSLSTQEAKDAIKQAIHSTSIYNEVTVNLNDITFQFSREQIDNESFAVDGINYEVTNNKILKMSNPSGFFIPDLLPFTQSDAESIYDKLDVHFDLSTQALSLQEAQQEAKKQEVIDDINTLFNGNATVQSIDINPTSVVINLDKPAYENGDWNDYQNANINVNKNVITLTYNSKPGDHNTNGFWAVDNTPAANIDLQKADAIYDAIFGADKVIYGTDTPQTAKAKITKAKANLQNVLGRFTSIENILVPNNNEIQIKVSNPNLFLTSNINTSSNKNTVNVSFDNSVLKLTKQDMFQSTNVQALLPETVADIYNSLFGANKLTKGQQLNEAASILETNKAQLIQDVSNAIGGNVNITDFWVYDKNWLVIDLQDYPFINGESNTTTVKLENGLTVKIDVKDVAGKHSLSIYLDRDSLFNYVNFSNQIGVKLYNAINAVAPLDRTLYWWQVRDKMGQTKEGIVNALNLPSKYISWGNYSDRIEVRLKMKLVGYSSDHNIGAEVNNSGTIIQPVTNRNGPGSTMLTVKIVNWEQGLFLK